MEGSGVEGRGERGELDGVVDRCSKAIQLQGVLGGQKMHCSRWETGYTSGYSGRERQARPRMLGSQWPG